MKFRSLVALHLVGLFLLSDLRAQGTAFPVDPTQSLTPIPVAKLSTPADNTGKLVNISTRGTVGAGDAVLVAGFVVSDSERFVLIRGVGPSLSLLGIRNFLKAPRIALYNSKGELIASAGSWRSLPQIDRDGLALVALEVGAFALGAAYDDAVLHRKLEPGAYTVVISSGDDQSGIALVEVYSSSTYSITYTGT